MNPNHKKSSSSRWVAFVTTTISTLAILTASLVAAPPAAVAGEFPEVLAPSIARENQKTLDTARVQSKAQTLQQEILADKAFMKTLPERTDKPMSAANIDKTNSLLKTKISSMRDGGKTATGVVGLGAALNAAMQSYRSGDREENAKTLGRLIPVVSNGLGIADGVHSKDPEPIVVNTIALGAMLVAVAFPAAGEFVFLGLTAYTIIKGIIAWWNSTDADERGCVIGSFFLTYFYAAVQPHCTQYYKKWYEETKNFVTGLFAQKGSFVANQDDGGKHLLESWAQHGGPEPWRITRLPEPTPDGLRAKASAAKAAADRAATAQAAAAKAATARTTAAEHAADMAHGAHAARIKAAFFTKDATAYNAAIKDAHLYDAAVKDATAAYNAAVKDAAAKAAVAKDAAAQAAVAKDAAAKDAAGT